MILKTIAMITRQTTWIVSIMLAFVSCKKEKFPDKDNLSGSWTEQTDNSFKHKLIFDSNTMLFIKSSTVDTLSYRLDKKSALIFLRLKSNSSAVESSHKILYNRKSRTLTFIGLFPSIDKTTETKFK